MSRSFFEKLNVLVRSQINDLVSFDKDEETRRRTLSRSDVRRGLSGDVKSLRQRVDEALTYEAELQGRVDELYDRIGELDRQADAAVAADRQVDARRAISQLQQAQREVQMLEADLREHRFVTQDLLSQVNTLEAMVNQAQPDEPTATQQTSPSSATTPTDADNDRIQQIGQNLLNKMNDTREKLGQLIDAQMQQINQPEQPQEADRQAAQGVASREVIVDEVPDPRPKRPPRSPLERSGDEYTPESDNTTSRTPAHPVNRQQVDDDLSARLARLSKPPAPPADTGKPDDDTKSE